MKKITLPPFLKLPKSPSFNVKFGREGEFFGSREKRKKHRILPVILILCGMMGGIFLSIIAMGLGSFWRVKDVTAQEGVLYSSSVVLAYADEAADLRPGVGVLGFDSYAVERVLKEKLPLLEKVNVKKRLNGTVDITFTEQTELYYTRHNQNYYIISAEDREVLCVSANPDEARRVGAVYLGIPEETRVRVGEELSFINLPYAPDSAAQEQYTYELVTDEPDQEFAYVFEFVDVLMKSPLADRVVGMELGDRFDLWFVLEGRIRVRIGTMDELDRKLTLAERSLQDKAQNGGLSTLHPTLVDVSDPARIIHNTSDKVEMPDWGR